ncbi:MAG: hypothetical protein Q8P13_03245 [bacterium]|nr:hypothetical protein [bacterium]
MAIVRLILEIIIAVIEILLVLRLVFVLLDSRLVGFVANVFSWTDPLIAPTSNFFPGLLPLFAILFAMFVYGLVFGILIALLRLV